MIFSFLAGIFITLQSVFNTRVSDKIGLVETTVIVHAIGFIVAAIAMIILGNGNFKRLQEVNKLYLLGGAFGVIIVYSVMKGISLLGATFSVAILLITQLIFATIIDTFGLFGSSQIKFDFTKLLGILIMIVGIIIFKLKG
ncbi:DMT family transporter [Clostridium cochlearium]|uniref:DMT family transporter n=1 Tax=Clostridium cochlearium TaxID=1494 RepID=UPI0031407933